MNFVLDGQTRYLQAKSKVNAYIQLSPKDVYEILLTEAIASTQGYFDICTTDPLRSSTLVNTAVLTI